MSRFAALVDAELDLEEVADGTAVADQRADADADADAAGPGIPRLSA